MMASDLVLAVEADGVKYVKAASIGRAMKYPKARFGTPFAIPASGILHLELFGGPSGASVQRSQLIFTKKQVKGNLRSFKLGAFTFVLTLDAQGCVKTISVQPVKAAPMRTDDLAVAPAKAVPTKAVPKAAPTAPTRAAPTQTDDLAAATQRLCLCH